MIWHMKCKFQFKKKIQKLTDIQLHMQLISTTLNNHEMKYKLVNFCNP